MDFPLKCGQKKMRQDESAACICASLMPHEKKWRLLLQVAVFFHFLLRKSPMFCYNKAYKAYERIERMSHNKNRLSIDAAKLYYESDMSQQKIADALGISRPSVSRLLQYAKEQGFVKIQIVDPVELRISLRDTLRKKYHLKEVRIANAPLNNEKERKKAMGMKAASYLEEIVQDGDIIGVGWGASLYQMAMHLTPKPVKGVQVVQLKGGISYSKRNTYAHEIVTLVAKAFSTSGFFLPIPVMFDNMEVKRLVEHDRYVKHILDVGRKANIAVATVGPASDESILFHLGYYIDADDREILSKKAAGDLCSRFYGDDGTIVDEELDARTIGIRLDEFKRKETRILIAGGKEKLRAMHAALKAGYMNTLITDRYTALALQDME